jgi:hypothetical protein
LQYKLIYFADINFIVVKLLTDIKNSMVLILGKHVIEQKITGNIGTTVIETKKIPVGLYIIRVNSSGKTIESEHVAICR